MNNSFIFEKKKKLNAQNYCWRRVEGEHHFPEIGASGNVARSNDQIRCFDSHPHSPPADWDILQIDLRPTRWPFSRLDLLKEGNNNLCLYIFIVLQFSVSFPTPLSIVSEK